VCLQHGLNGRFSFQLSPLAINKAERIELIHKRLRVKHNSKKFCQFPAYFWPHRQIILHPGGRFGFMPPCRRLKKTRHDDE